MAQHPDNLIWIDLEMTGLDTQRDVVIEIATIVTDAQLNILAEGPVIAMHQPEDVLDGTLAMLVSAWDPWVGDFVDANDVPFLGQFPFLAAPH